MERDGSESLYLYKTIEAHGGRGMGGRAWRVVEGYVEMGRDILRGGAYLERGEFKPGEGDGQIKL